MPRFKQPLQGLSRLSDRMEGGGGGNSYHLVSISGNTSNNNYSFSGHQADDWLILITWSGGSTPPNAANGFTTDFTQSFPFSIQGVRVQYQIATSSSTVSGNSGGSLARSAQVIMRGIKGFGNHASFDPSSTAATEFSAIPDFTKGSFVIGASPPGSDIQGVTRASDFQMIYPLLSPLSGVAIPLEYLDSFDGIPSFTTPTRTPTLSIEVLL